MTITNTRDEEFATFSNKAVDRVLVCIVLIR